MFDWNTDLVYTLRGPRQVGKTTLLKLIIKDMLAESISPDHILYLDCENMERRSELVNSIQAFVKWIRRRSQRRLFLFVDETTAVNDWERAVKYLWDSGSLHEATCVFTGSHSIDLKRCAERLPGRRGQSEVVLDKLLLSMKFSEYVESLDSKIKQMLKENGLLSEEERKSVLNSLCQGKIPDSLDKAQAFVDELNVYLEQYFITGGIAPVIDDFAKMGRIPDSRYRDYLNVVLGDLSKLRLRESYVKQIISRLIDTVGNPVSWRTLKNDTDISHHDTVSEYVERLGDNFTLSHFYFFDAGKKRPSFVKDKKIHFRDPFVFHTLRTWVQGGAPFRKTLEYLRESENTGRMAECVGYNHAIRLAFLLSDQKHTFDPMSSVFYWRTDDKEVDLVVRINGDFLPIEVKYQTEISSGDLFAISKFRATTGSRFGIILSKDQTQVGRNAVILPMSLFLLLV